MTYINDTIVGVSLVALVCINSIYIGYLIGQRTQNYTTRNDPQNFFAKNSANKKEVERASETKSISIDESKVVVSLDTTDLEKKYQTLGDVKQSGENISSSIDRLKHLKK
jgi:hypothetical protein